MFWFFFFNWEKRSFIGQSLFLWPIRFFEYLWMKILMKEHFFQIKISVINYIMDNTMSLSNFQLHTYCIVVIYMRNTISSYITGLQMWFRRNVYIQNYIFFEWTTLKIDILNQHFRSSRSIIIFYGPENGASKNCAI